MLRESLHIILIDDDEVDTEAVTRLLQGRPAYRLTTFADGSAAREALDGPLGRQLGDSPCLILLDINMPRLNGFEFLAWLRNTPSFCGVVVFVFTTSQWENDLRRAYQLHVAGYLIKSRLGIGYAELVDLLDAYAELNNFPPAVAAA